MADAAARRSHVVLADGTVGGSAATAGVGTDDGLLAHLPVTLPGTCPALVDQHLEHFAVQLRSWVLHVAREQPTFGPSA
ncbi:hypothetical protein WDZ17_14270 [Pseudokineococcus basanitobsidens]|uniref:Uncharacterized protein n=1 Tax=Pseudokineococcus basanitobsidens TaxID=1926649 RepID=A0ABU8RNB1_9ACTN